MPEEQMEQLTRRIQQKISGCSICELFEDGEPMGIYGNLVPIEELLYAYGLPEKFWDSVAYLLYCPNCGDSGFSRYDLVAQPARYHTPTEYVLPECANG